LDVSDVVVIPMHPALRLVTVQSRMSHCMFFYNDFHLLVLFVGESVKNSPQYFKKNGNNSSGCELAE
jgi:hypothetical protein